VIAVSPQSQIYVQTAPINFRNGIDGLVRQCREVLKLDPFSGALFVFRNQRGTSIKILFYDSQGFWVAQKRFSEGRIRHWPQGNASNAIQQFAARELQTLLWNGSPVGASYAPTWKELPKEI
jgi:transposase